MKFYRLLLLSLIIFASVSNVDATIKVYNLSGKVCVKLKGGNRILRKGDILDLNDMLIIPDGGRITIIDDISNKVYGSQKSGKIMVSKLIMDANEKSGNKLESINKQLKSGSATKLDNKERIFKESGLSKRKIENEKVFIEEAVYPIEMTAAYLRNLLLNNNGVDTLPVPVIISDNENQETSVRIDNTLDCSLFYMVITLNDKNELRASDLIDSASEIVISPRSSVVISFADESDTNCKTFLVVSQFNIDITQLIEAFNSSDKGENSYDYTIEKPKVYIKEL